LREFEVRPITHYEGARYPSWRAQPDAEARRCSIVVVATSIALAAGLALGLVACDEAREPDFERTPAVAVMPPGLDGPPPPDPLPAPACEPGEIWCEDLETVVICNDDGTAATATDCAEYCLETTGYQPYAYECNADAEEPCQCEYDIVAGCSATVYPSDFPAGSFLPLLALAWRRGRRKRNRATGDGLSGDWRRC